VNFHPLTLCANQIKALAQRSLKGSLSSTFYTHVFVQKCFAQLISSYIFALWLFGRRILMKKVSVKCWWNWLLGSHFWTCTVWPFPVFKMAWKKLFPSFVNHLRNSRHIYRRHLHKQKNERAVKPFYNDHHSDCKIVAMWSLVKGHLCSKV